MNSTTLREALHETARAGMGQVDDARLARMADTATGGGSPSAMSSGRVRRRWAVGAMAVAAVLLLFVVATAQLLRPVDVTPASGPGSLPDQIFPSREHILTLEQAPIDRASLVYAGPLLEGATSWVAIGADGDEYRALTPASAHLEFDDNVDIAPDGATVVVGRGGARSGDLRLEFVDVATGSTRVVELPDDGAGGSIDSLLWGSNEGQVAVLANVIDPTDRDLSSGRARCFVVDTESGTVIALPRKAVLAGELAGWTPDGKLVLVDGPGAPSGRLVVSAADQDEVTRLATLPGLPLGFSRAALSPDGRLLAGLVDPTPSAFGDGSVWDLQVYDLEASERVLSSNLSSYAEDQTWIIGWRDANTPVLSAARPGADGPGVLVAYDAAAGTHEVIVRAGAAGVPRYYLTSRVAADVLASGGVRKATPPEQPWYDPRTAWAALRDGVTGEVVFGMALVLLVLGGVLVTRLSRRRREVSSRSGS